MKIGIVGTGHVGGTLGSRWAQGGHDVTFGTRHPDSPEIMVSNDLPALNVAITVERLARRTALVSEHPLVN